VIVARGPRVGDRLRPFGTGVSTHLEQVCRPIGTGVSTHLQQVRFTPDRSPRQGLPCRTKSQQMRGVSIVYTCAYPQALT
jgi:hypothetical protein